MKAFYISAENEEVQSNPLPHHSSFIRGSFILSQLSCHLLLKYEIEYDSRTMPYFSVVDILFYSSFQLKNLTT
jgi:hypothetical protein